jgi:hypothetical protein
LNDAARRLARARRPRPLGLLEVGAASEVRQYDASARAHRRKRLVKTGQNHEGDKIDILLLTHNVKMGYNDAIME